MTYPPGTWRTDPSGRSSPPARCRSWITSPGGSAIGSRWLAQTSKEQVAALRALRLARLARYQSRLDDADYFAAAALTRATPTIRSVAEEAMVLAAREKPGEIGPILAKYPGATGSLSSGRDEEAPRDARKRGGVRERLAEVATPANRDHCLPRLSRTEPPQVGCPPRRVG